MGELRNKSQRAQTPRCGDHRERERPEGLRAYVARNKLIAMPMIPPITPANDCFGLLFVCALDKFVF